MKKGNGAEETDAVAAPRSPMQVAAALECLRRDPVRLIGRDAELAEVHAALVARRSVFPTGPAGVGKSAVLQALYAGWDAAREGLPLIYCNASRTRRCIATQVLVNLLLAHGRLTTAYLGRRRAVASLTELRRFVSNARLSELRRMMHQNLHRHPFILLLDHLDQADPRVAALIEVWLERTPLVLVARDRKTVGRLRWLLCDLVPVHLSPLPAAALVSVAMTRRRSCRACARARPICVGRRRWRQAVPVGCWTCCGPRPGGTTAGAAGSSGSW